MVYEISLEFPGFAGTLDLLVERVRRFEVDILDVKISEVARQVVDGLKDNIDLQFFAPVLTVSRLMFLKSRSLLPGRDMFEETELEEENPEQVEEETQVRMRLEEQYRVFSGAGEHMRGLAEENRLRIRSYQTRAGELPGFIDEIAYIEDITPFDLMVVMNQILKRALRDDTYRVRVDDAQLLSRRISEVFDFILARRGESVTFDEIRERTPQKTEAVLSFLALVYLVSQGRVIARQHTPYGEIIISVRHADRRQFQDDDG